MVALWPLVAFAGGTSPEERVEVFGDVGVMTGELAMLFGAGAGTRHRGFTAVGTLGFGPRSEISQDGLRTAFGLGSLALALDAPFTGSTRVGGGIVLEGALLDGEEADCSFRGGCRHGWFLEATEGTGFAFQPAYGLRLSGSGTSGAAFQTFAGIQPHYYYGELVWFAPRLDLAVYGVGSWSFHAWGGRYGVGLGIGRRLSRSSPAG